MECCLSTDIVGKSTNFFVYIVLGPKRSIPSKFVLITFSWINVSVCLVFSHIYPAHNYKITKMSDYDDSNGLFLGFKTGVTCKVDKFRH